MASSINLELSSIFEYVYLTAYIRYCAEDKYLKFWELKDRKIGNHEFLLITKGTGQFNINNRTYNVKKMIWFFLNLTFATTESLSRCPLNFFAFILTSMFQI